MRFLATLLVSAAFAGMANAAPVHGIAMHGAPALPADFKHFSYVNPDVKTPAARSPMAWSAHSMR